ncbi:hypothetical protein Q8A67_005678 [Cirrhinus molitorella]|uniref:Ig-like domain-containing protein n=1 Tax=Cirrhinus molitorella TaxID=172907 RepID=A0AA88Q6H8_9TELE|nr:hypothetical protein Q8A67_005678 [Cirrhinus molitorella]
MTHVFIFLFLLLLHLPVHGCSVGSGEVSVMEGDSVTLLTDVETNQQQEIIWRFNDTIIAAISGDLSFICTDVQCNKDTERFRDRLKLNHQTGSLTITNINTTDSGLYHLQISSSSNSVWRSVSITVIGVTAAELNQMNRKSVKEGESVTLETLVKINKPNNLLWHFNETPITEINGEKRKICTDDECEEGDGRLEMDHQTGSLTINNIRITDSGLYKLQINIDSTIRITSEKIFSVTVTADQTRIYAPVSAVLVFLVVTVFFTLIYSCHSRRKCIRAKCSEQANGDEVSLNQTYPLATNTPNESIPNQTESETVSETLT